MTKSGLLQQILKLTVLFPAVLVPACASAQGYFETVHRFGYHSLYGSAKSLGMAGVQMGTGGEGPALAFNPAAPGLYRKSDMQISFMPYLNSTRNTFRDGEVGAERTGLPIASFSMSLANLKEEMDDSDIRCGVFTISYNRRAVFTRKENYEGLSPVFSAPGQFRDNSILDGYLSGANLPGFTPSDLIASNPDDQLVFNDNYKNDLVMAFEGYLLDTSQNRFVTAFPRSDLIKSGYHDQKLNQGIWNFGYSVNLRDKIYLGASFGYTSSRYEHEISYREEIRNVFVEPTNPNFSYLQGFRGVNFEILRNLTQRMRGINGNIGIVYKASDELRLSGAVQLPTLSWISETYSPRLNSTFNGLRLWSDRDVSLTFNEVTWFENEFSYKLRLPAVLRAGATWVADKKGMLSLEMEYTNLGRARLTEGDGGYNFVEETRIIPDLYRPTLSIRAGGELRYGDFRFRTGMAFMPSPVRRDAEYRDQMPGDALHYTFGAGAKFENWYWDIGLVFGSWKTRSNFVPGYDPDVQSRISTSQLRLGIGFNM